MHLGFWQRFYEDETYSCSDEIRKLHLKNKFLTGDDIYHYISLHLQNLLYYGIIDVKFLQHYLQGNSGSNKLAANYRYGNYFNISNIEIFPSELDNHQNPLFKEIESTLRISSLRREYHLGSGKVVFHKILYLLHNIYLYFDLSELAELCIENVDEDLLSDWKRTLQKKIDYKKSKSFSNGTCDKASLAENRAIEKEKDKAKSSNLLLGFFNTVSFWIYFDYRFKKSKKIWRIMVSKLKRDMSSELYITKGAKARTQIRELYKKRIKKYENLQKRIKK